MRAFAVITLNNKLVWRIFVFFFFYVNIIGAREIDGAQWAKLAGSWPRSIAPNYIIYTLINAAQTMVLSIGECQSGMLSEPLIEIKYTYYDVMHVRLNNFMI